jgi:hypothetical protein
MKYSIKTEIEIRNEIAERLRYVRENLIINGVKISAGQFAEIFDTSEDKIRNYENSRSNISIELLIDLYYHGINPIFILTGDGSVYANNSSGIELQKQSLNSDLPGKIVELRKIDTSHYNEDELLSIINAAAGDIANRLRNKKE